MSIVGNLSEPALVSRLVRVIAYVWAGPGTLVGLPLALLALVGGGRGRIVDGVWEVSAERVLARLSRWAPVPGGISAITFGHLVLGGNDELLHITRRHERVHVGQYERWGPFFLPAYLGCSVWIWCRGGDPYRENPFEVAAYAIDDPHAR